MPGLLPQGGFLKEQDGFCTLQKQPRKNTAKNLNFRSYCCKFSLNGKDLERIPIKTKSESVENSLLRTLFTPWIVWLLSELTCKTPKGIQLLCQGDRPSCVLSGCHLCILHDTPSVAGHSPIKVQTNKMKIKSTCYQ